MVSLSQAIPLFKAHRWMPGQIIPYIICTFQRYVVRQSCLQESSSNGATEDVPRQNLNGLVMASRRMKNRERSPKTANMFLAGAQPCRTDLATSHFFAVEAR